METHEMMITFTDTDKTETWECLQCPRKFLITSWNPFNRTILNDGEDKLRHVGYKGPAGFNINVDVTTN
jgi:hypothetical protein